MYTTAWSDNCYFHNYTATENETTPLNGATRAMVVEGQREAKKRVLIFISIYVVTGAMSKYIATH